MPYQQMSLRLQAAQLVAPRLVRDFAQRLVPHLALPDAAQIAPADALGNAADAVRTVLQDARGDALEDAAAAARAVVVVLAVLVVVQVVAEAAVQAVQAVQGNVLGALVVQMLVQVVQAA